MALTARQHARWRSLAGGFDPGMSPPRVARVPRTVARPLWSVMIPTFNCAGLLRETLASVLAQDPGPRAMQIEVVDDASTRDDPEGVVRELGGGRVAFHRKDQNEGAIRNFNTCLARSRGRLVHLLHGDDTVEPGFYARMAGVAAAHPRVAGFFARCRIMDEDGSLESLAPRLRSLTRPTRTATELYQTNAIYTPGAVVRRSFYERHGGFLPPLVHCADWEMWMRVISRGGGLWLNEVLASYRLFTGNDTNRLVRSGENIRDHLRVAATFAERFSDFDYGLCERTLARQALRQMQRCAALGDRAGVAANRTVFHLLASPWRRRFLAQWDREIGIRPGRSPR
jgi:glycosyltransferase involved in cell wall biosynthesis